MKSVMVSMPTNFCFAESHSGQARTPVSTIAKNAWNIFYQVTMITSFYCCVPHVADLAKIVWKFTTILCWWQSLKHDFWPVSEWALCQGWQALRMSGWDRSICSTGELVSEKPDNNIGKEIWGKLLNVEILRLSHLYWFEENLKEMNFCPTLKKLRMSSSGTSASFELSGWTTAWPEFNCSLKKWFVGLWTVVNSKHKRVTFQS